jgi:nucleotide-binding universal stress UspA family protein
MKKILIPTDLSENVSQTLSYLLPLVIAQNAEVHLVHAVDDPFVKEERKDFDDTGVEKYTTDILYKMRAEADADMEKFASLFRASWEQSGNPLPVYSTVENGLPDEIILTKAAAIQPQLIILGRHHHNRMDRLFFGSVTQSVMQKTHFPVLILPQQFVYAQPKEILYMSDMDDHDIISIGKLINLLQPFSINLHIVHFNINEIGTEEKLFALGEKIKNDHQEIPITYETVDGEILRVAWQQYIQKRGIDLIALTAHKHNGLQRLLNQDTAVDVLYHSNLPLMVMHKY